jgi:CRISPR/Cas system CMR-associated protein Cmr1 (group 7 of RAMP superfamily)
MSDFFDDLKKHIIPYTILSHFSKIGKKSYLFGSSVWKIALNETNTSDYDIVVGSKDDDDNNVITKMITKLRETFPSHTFSFVRVENASDSYEFPIMAYRHYILTIFDECQKMLPCCDIICCDDIYEFQKSLCDIDSGMLLYDFTYGNILTGGDSGILDVNQVINSCKERKLSVKYVHELLTTKKVKTPRTTFYRIIKKIKQGFTYDVEEICELLCVVFTRSFCTHNDNKSNQNTKKCLLCIAMTTKLIKFSKSVMNITSILKKVITIVIHFIQVHLCMHY